MRVSDHTGSRPLPTASATERQMPSISPDYESAVMATFAHACALPVSHHAA